MIFLLFFVFHSLINLLDFDQKLISCCACYIFIIFYVNIIWFFYSIYQSCFSVFLEFYNINLTCFALISVLPSCVTIHDLNFSCVQNSMISHLFLFPLSAYALPEFSPLNPLRCHQFSWWLSILSHCPHKIWPYAPLPLLRHINLRLNHRLCKVSMYKMKVIPNTLCKCINLPVSTY